MDVYAFPLFGERKEYPILNSPLTNRMSQFHRMDIGLFTRPTKPELTSFTFNHFPPTQIGRRQAAHIVDGRQVPVWRRDGKELFIARTDR
jgi:hypothetical protein